MSVAGASSSEGYRPSTWYQKYDVYPEYCSTPETMELRRIPGLREKDKLIGETRLVHVTAVIRHGARTPWSSNERCWQGYWDASKDTSRWDCELNTVMAPPDPNAVAQEEGDSTNFLPDDAFFLYEKVYDALNSGEEGALRNELNGTCQVGQLLVQGYEQQIQNGKILREAYGYRENDYSHDERMRLFDLTSAYSFSENYKKGKLPWDKDHLYFRADDDQRTVMSGQVLLRGLFDREAMEKFMDDGTYPNVVLHIADRDRDVLGANTVTCPRLRELEDAGYKSQEYQSFNNSDKMNSLRWYARDKLGASDNVEFLDCLMTTICTDRELPDPVNDFGSTGADGSMFEALAEADIMSYNLVIKHNNSEHSKLAMGPVSGALPIALLVSPFRIILTSHLIVGLQLWAEIMTNINPFLSQSGSSGDSPAPKFALFSGHDTTIIPLLASLDPGLWNSTDWAPYASMVLIEVRFLCFHAISHLFKCEHHLIHFVRCVGWFATSQIHELIDGISNRKVYTTDFAFRLLFNGKILTSLVPGCHPDAELCDVAILKKLIDPIATRDPDCSLKLPLPIASSSSKEVIVKAHTLLKTTEGILMLLGLVVLGILVGATTTFIVLTGRLPWPSRQVLFTHDIDDDLEGRVGLQSSSSYGDDDLSEEGEQEFVDAAGRG
jgi:Histidine phosphatase superfamily (branch 2)